ncbi:MAG: hypothetical protein M0Q43_01755 [Methanothrix sp.]|jgi:hypothetical protein|nr:hypothetical protein [Methanothrix sp.]
MSKIWNILGLAVLGIALLVGMATAETTANGEVDGCVIPAAYLALTSTLTVGGADLGPFAEGIETVSGGSLGVVSGGLYQITVEDSNDLGTMHTGAPGSYQYLDTVLHVNDVSLDTTAVQIVNDGVANVICDPTEHAIHYDQTVTAGDMLGTAGDYAISLVYTLATRT